MTQLDWQGCVNVRDLGGLEAPDGRRVRPGRLVRADNIRALSDDGWRALVDHGVTRIVDLRFPEELADDVPAEAPVEVVHISLLGTSRTAEWEAEFNAAMDRAPHAEAYLVWSYLEFLERYRSEFARVFEAIAPPAPDDGAVLVHCMGGKDRTGLVVGLILRLLGVSIDEIAADYALTEANLAPAFPAWVAAAPDAAERRRRELLLPSPAAAMRTVLTELESRYGSVDAYLRACGVTPVQLGAIRERLLGAA